MMHVHELPVRHCRPSEDVIPFSECRNNLSSYIGRVQETHRPILITQNGRAASYIVNASDMDKLLDMLELTQDVEISRQEIAAGKGIPHAQVMKEMDELIARVSVRRR